MRAFTRRRLRNATITIAVVAAVAYWVDRRAAALESSSFGTGWLLLAGIGFLALLQVRKRLPTPPLGAASTWLQAHIYVGMGSAGVYLLHTGLAWPSGRLEATLAGLYFATFVSGLVGLFWSRTAPVRLARAGEEYIYEQIPMLRGQLRDQAQSVVLATVRSSGESTLGEFYDQELADFFGYPRRWRYRLRPTSRLRKALLAKLTEATRYFSDAERKTAEQLFALIRKRDNLDYHDALQWRLKAWLFVHIGLTYPLLIAAALHAWTAHLFYGGLP